MIYKDERQNMTTPCKILVPTYAKKNGKEVPVYPDVDDASNEMFFCSFKTYGGTEKVIDGVYAIEDTANIFGYYTPTIKSNCRIVRLQDNAVFSVINEPENVDMRNQFIKFKVKRIKGSV